MPSPVTRRNSTPLMPESSSSAPRNTTRGTSADEVRGTKRPLDANASASPEPKRPKTEPEPKDNTTEARLKRAKIRDERRRASADAVSASGGRDGFMSQAQDMRKSDPKTAGKQRLETNFGPVTASPFPTKDPGYKITTQAKDYDKKSVGHRYGDLVKGLRSSGATDAQIATALLEPDKAAHLNNPEAKNAAAKLSAIMGISEPQRVPGSDKAGRGALRMVADGKMSLDEALTGDTPGFPMAKNPNYMRRVVNYTDTKQTKPPERPAQFDQLAGYMSDSSDEESVSGKKSPR